MDDFEPRHAARNSDPITSHDAAEEASCFVGQHKERILRALKLYGPSTAHELQERTGLTVVQIDRRLPELEESGFAAVATDANGQDLMRGGARVWEIVKKAK